eukprot:m.34477 g.34477  ORF g.34477 m.34477 type:complete len:547 (+) comp8735_c0_seq1:219-1859(+)
MKVTLFRSQYDGKVMERMNHCLCSFFLFLMCSTCCSGGQDKLNAIHKREAEDHSVTADDAFSMAKFQMHHGCITLLENQEKLCAYQSTDKVFVSEIWCAKTCASQAYTVFGIEYFTVKDKRRCWCTDKFIQHYAPEQELDCVKAQAAAPNVPLSYVGNITSPLPKIVHIVQLTRNVKAPGLLGMPNQFEKKYFRQFAVRRPPRVQDKYFKEDQDIETQRAKHCKKLQAKFCDGGRNKQLKIIILSSVSSLDSNLSPDINLLANWPSKSLLFFGQDELLTLPYDKTLLNEFGGVDSMRNGNFTPAKIPQHVRPYFIQYWDHYLPLQKQSKWFTFVPLWIRQEFNDAPSPEHITLSSQRPLVYTYIVALTSGERKQCAKVMEKETIFTDDQKFIHIAKRWNRDPNSEEYVNADDYRHYLSTSVFTLAPSGHNADQYRIYEALVAGCIPVVSKQQMDSLPTFYKDSGILIVNNWEEAPQVLMSLWKDKEKLDARQQEVMKFGDQLLKDASDKLANALKAKLQEEDTELCKYGKLKLKPLFQSEELIVNT